MKLFNKIDFSVVTEVIGIVFVATGLAMFSVPLSLIAVGGFLVWLTEKGE
jgi:hypothetical protein